jgi:hypothetical protein
MLVMTEARDNIKSAQAQSPHSVRMINARSRKDDLPYKPTMKGV